MKSLAIKSKIKSISFCKSLKYIFISLYSLLFLALISLYFITDKRYYVIATLAGSVSALIISFTNFHRRANTTLAIAFLLLSVADPGVSLTIIGNSDKFLIFSPWIYSLFAILIFIYLYNNNSTDEGKKNKIIIYFIRSSVFILYFSVYSYYVTIPSFIIKHHPFTPEFNIIALIKISGTFTYSIFISLALAFALPQSIATKIRFNLFFTNSLIFMFVGDIVESNSWTYVDQAAQERVSRIAFAYSIWWTIGLYIIAFCCIYYNTKRIPKDKALNYRNFYSIRSIISIIMIFCLPPFLAFFSKVRIVSDYTLYDGIDVAMSVCFIAFLGNIIGDILSKNTSKLSETYDEDNNAIRKNMFIKINKRISKLEELENIVDSHNKNVDLAEKFYDENIENSKKAVIADLTKDFAHEAKRPLNLVSSFIKIIANESNSKEILKNCYKFIKPINSSILSVDGYIKDILNYGTKKSASTDSVIIEEIISSSLDYISALHYSKTISVKYNLLHDRKIFINNNSLSRIFENILNNAIQAVKNDAIEFEIETMNEILDNEYYVSVRIRNYDSSIDKNELSHIFEESYSKNKKEGSGRGLFITEKLVLDYGGYINANSGYNNEKCREFFEIKFTIKSKNNSYCKDISFVKDKYNFSSFNVDIEGFAQSEQIDLNAKKIIMNYVKSLNRKFSILVADDDLITLDYMNKIFSKLDNEILNFFIIHYESKVEEIKKMVQYKSFDLAILDIDFKDNKYTGIDFAELIKKKNNKAIICIHSNLPKISEYQFIDIIHPKIIDLFTLINIVKNSLAKNLELKNIVFIDDEVDFFDSWKEDNCEYNFIYFKNWEDFNLSIRSKEIKIKNIELIFTDYYFKNGITPFTDTDGSQYDEVTSFINMCNYKGKIIILSNDTYGVKVPDGCNISAIMPKIPIKISQILA